MPTPNQHKSELEETDLACDFYFRGEREEWSMGPMLQIFGELPKELISVSFRMLAKLN